MKTLVHSIPGKLETYWLSDANSMLDIWTTYSITLAEFKETILERGIKYAKANKANAWIVDSSGAKGAFGQEIQEFIGTDVLPSFAKAGIKYFITILPKDSAVTKMTVKNYSAKVGPSGIKLVEVNNIDDAVKWLKQNQQH